MRRPTTSPISHCPICGRGEITAAPESVPLRRRRKLLPCPTCGAKLVPSGANAFKLSYCAPHRLGQRGCKFCAGYVPNVCYLDTPLSTADLDRMSQGKPPLAVEEFLEASKKLKSGDLPVVEIPALANQLAPGEMVHHASQRVYTNEWHLPGAPDDGGELIVTNRRLLFCAARGCSSLSYDDIAELVEESPGFFVRLRREQEPRYFFPPSLDPVYSAVVGALKNFRQAGESAQQQ